MRWGGTGTFRDSTRYGPSTALAGLKRGRPSSSICISVSWFASAWGSENTRPVNAAAMGSMRISSSSIACCQ